MAKRIIKLPRFAFETIISQVIEPYKKEAFGVIGGKGRNVYYIKEVFPIQTADRKLSKIETYYFREQRLKDTIINFGNKVIGDYHSHTDYFGTKANPSLSEFDKKMLKKNPHLFSVVVSIEEVTKIYGWRLLNNMIMGSLFLKGKYNDFNKKVKVTFVSFYYDPKKNRFLKMKINPIKDLENILKN